MSPELKYNLLSTQFESKLERANWEGHNRGVSYMASLILNHIKDGKNMCEIIKELNDHIEDSKNELYKIGVQND